MSEHQKGKKLYTEKECDDSHYDSDSEQCTPQVQDDKKEGIEPESLPVLRNGLFTRYAHDRWRASVSNSAGSWAFLLCYLYTETVVFAPLTSQGVDSRARYVQVNEKYFPCSPKAVYSLATAVSFHLPVHQISVVIQNSMSSLALKTFALSHSITYDRNSLPIILSPNSFLVSPLGRYHA